VQQSEGTAVLRPLHPSSGSLCLAGPHELGALSPDSLFPHPTLATQGFCLPQPLPHWSGFGVGLLTTHFVTWAQACSGRGGSWH
jgi:hypothetical protein